MHFGVPFDDITKKEKGRALLPKCHKEDIVITSYDSVNQVICNKTHFRTLWLLWVCFRSSVKTVKALSSMKKKGKNWLL